MIKRKQNTKTIKDQKETEHNDCHWSKGNSFWSLIVFVFYFLLIIDSLCVLFPFDQWQSLCYVAFWSLIVFVFCFLLIIDDQKETEHKDYQWSKGNRTQRLSMIKRKQNTKTINDQKETEHKDYQWSKGNIAQRLSMNKRLCVLFPFVQWQSLCYVAFWSLIVFVFCFLLIIDSLCVLFPFDHW
jgi:hypothetical protein